MLERVPEETSLEASYCAEGGDQNHPQEKEMQSDKIIF